MKLSNSAIGNGNTIPVTTSSAAIGNATLRLFNAYNRSRIKADNAAFSVTSRQIFRTLNSSLFQTAMIVNIRHVIRGNARTAFFINSLSIIICRY